MPVHPATANGSKILRSLPCPDRPTLAEREDDRLCDPCHIKRQRVRLRAQGMNLDTDALAVFEFLDRGFHRKSST